MKLTDEQQHILGSCGDIRINAVAGSGKTSTLIEYARTRPAGSRILYLAFNKTVRQEAQRRFEEKGLKNVQIETAHSLAYKRIVLGSDYTLKNPAYKTHEICEMLKLNGHGEKHAEFIMANHVSRFLSYYCNSRETNIENLNYLDVVKDENAAAFVKSHYQYIEKQTALLYLKMEKAQIAVSHDFYLKKFQLSVPKLNFNYILFDEAQDASEAMLDVFCRQHATRVLVGDTHQQIYSWRFAVNSLEKINFRAYELSNSFRFSEDIATLAREILNWKHYLKQDGVVKLTGIGTCSEVRSRAIIARSNLGLLLKAIGYVTENKKNKKIYFEGNFHSYTYADEGASLYDVLNLYNGKRQYIRDKLILSLKSMDELEDYVRKTEDMQLGMMLEIVKEYGNEVPGIIKTIKERHVEERSKADMIFSTVHRCKGMEYDEVELVNDFITQEKLEKLQREGVNKELDITRYNEEINLLYVAVTRARKILNIPPSLLPVNYKPAENIQILHPPDAGIQDQTPALDYGEHQKNKGSAQKPKAYSVEKLRESYRQAYLPWTDSLDSELTEMYCEGISIKEMAQHFGRTRGAILSRIKKLELEELYG